MEGAELTLPNGNKIPLAWYLSEGTTLSDSVSEFDISRDPKLEEIKKNLLSVCMKVSFIVICRIYWKCS